MQDNINKLYNVLKNDGYEDLGTEEKFRNFVNDSANVKKLYGVLKNDGYEDLGTEDQFISFVMPKQQTSKPQGMIATAIQAPEPPASIAKPENGLPLQKFNVAEQNQENAEEFRMQQKNTPFMRQQRATEQQTTAMNQPAFPDIEAPQLSRSIGDDRQKYKEMVSQAIKNAVGAKSETALADAMKATKQELARQGYDMDALQDSGLLSEGIDNVLIPTAEAAVTKGRKIIDKVFSDALTKAKAARSRHIEPLRYAGAQSDLQMLTNELAGERAYQQEIDPDKLQAQLINAIDKDGLQETFKEVYRQASKYGINPKEYFNTYVAPHLKENAARALDKFMTDQYMPKDDAEYILSGFSNSITGMLSDWLTKSAKQNAYKQMALSKYDASTGTQIAREAVGLLSSAPEFVVSGGAASAVTKKVCGKAIQNIMAKGFTRMQAQRILTSELASKFGQRVAERIVQSSVSGSANFATLESMSEAARQLRDDDFNAGKIALKGVEGAGKGAIFGAVSGGYAGATSELTGATKIISNFLGIPANGLSLTLSSNAINEISKMMGGEDELMEVDAEGNSKRKSFMQQWADNTLLDLMMRGTSPHNLNVITREGRTDISNRIRSFFSPLSESQQIIGKSFGSGISEEGQGRLMQITGTDNLRDALMSGVPKASDMPSLPFQAGRIDGKTRSRSVDDLLREEQRSVMQQNWDKIMHDRELTAADKAKLCAIMGAKYHANPSVTTTTVTGADGEKYVEYRDAAGMLNERVPLYDADLGLEAQNKLRMRNIYGKTSALGKTGEYAVAAGAMRYAMEPDADGNAPTEAQQKARMKEYFDRFRKGELTDMEITELEADLNKATLGYDGADKIKVLKHGDGTASVQYTKNGVPVRTDHFGTEEEANERASRDLYQQQLNSINEWREDVGIPLDDGSKLSIEQVYELKNNMPLGTLQQAIEGYPGMSMDEVRDKLLNSGLTSVDLVTGPDGIIRTAEQDKLIRDYYDWAKKTVEGMDAKKAQPDTEGLYQMGEGGAPDSIIPAFKAPETPIAENGPGTEEERTYNGPTTEAQVQQPEVQPVQQPEVQPEAVPAAAPQNAINENTSHGKAYSSGYNAVSANDLTTVKAIKDNHELAVRRVNNVVKNTNPVIENILSLTKQGKHAEAHALIDSTPMPEEQADALRQYVDADASMDGINNAMEEIKSNRIREYQAKVEAQAQENGEDVTIVVLDNSGKKAKLVKGDLDNMGGTVMIHDLDANDNPVGEPHQVHVKQIKRVFPTQKVKDMIFAERKRIQQEIDAYFDNAVSPTNFEIGKKVALKDGENIVEATVVSVNPDGSINFQSETGEVIAIKRADAEKMATDAKEEGYGMVLQAEAEAREATRKQAEAQQKAQAEAEARRQAEEAARKAEEERRKNPLNRLKRREDNTIDYTNSNPDDVAELLQNLGAKGKTAAQQELVKVQQAIEENEAAADEEQATDGIDALLAQEDRQDQRNARIDELKHQKAFWMDQISRIEAREEAIRKEEERKEAEKLKREQQRQRSIAAFNKPINDARKRMADDPDAMQILEENNREPRTLKEAVADLIPKNGLVLKNWTDSYGRKHLGLEGELGMEAEDLKKLSYFMGKLENGATDISTLAERIYENLSPSLQEQAPDGSRDIRDLIIELLSEAQNADHIIHYIDNARIREAEAVYDANKAAEAEYERAMAEHNQEVENETAPTYSAAEDPFSGSAAEAPFSFRGIRTEADRQRHNKRVRKVGGLILDTESLPLEEKTKNLLDAIGRQLGKIFQVDPRVIEVGADGISQGDVIFLSPETVKNGDRFTRKISGHELTHAIKASSRDVRGVWDKFLTFVQESMGKEKFNRLVDEKLSLYTDHIAEIISRRDSILKQANPSAEDLEYAQHYANLKMPTREGMMEEVASDFVGEHILTDEKFITDLVKRVEMSKADSASIIQRMRAFIDKMLAYLESLARPTSAERRARVALERARDIWADMYELVAAQQREDLIGNAEAGDEAFSLPKFSIIKPRDKELTEDDKKAIEDLNSGDKTKTKTVYRAMQVIDGKLYPPMAAKIDGKLVESAKEGDILKADEHPELIKMINGKPQFILDKGSKDATGRKASSVPARYNPYWHTSNSPMNDQFKSAWIRPNLVTVECEIPVSELTSGYKAKYAKDAVGMVPWKSGSVTGELVKQGHPGREVYLSRYCKIGRTLTDAETAQMIKDFIGDKDVSIPENVVTPKVRAELEKLGVKIGEPEKGVNKTEQIEEAIANGLEVDKKTILGERGGAVSGNPSSKNLPLEGSEHLSHRALTLPKDAAKLQKNSETTINSAKKIINSGEFKRKTDTAAQAVSALGHSLHLEKSGSSQSYYQDYYEGDFVVDGKIVRVRISTHPATGKRIGNAPVDDKISIVIYKDGEHKDRGAHNGYVEYIYHPENISPKDASMAIVKSIEGLIRNGEYVDETGLAQKQEYPYIDDNGNMRFSFSERDKQTESKEFKDWFGDWEKDPKNASKIVDEEGKPMVMYHGSLAKAKDIDQFKMLDGSMGKGAYFTSSYEEACDYAKQQLAGTKGFPKDPEDISDEDVEQYVGAYYLNVRNPMDITHSRFDRNAIEVLATSPEQIKSVTENNGNFDRNNQDIRFSLGKDAQTIARDKEYADAVAAGDDEKIDAMLREEAAKRGYSDNSDYQGSLAFNGAAPSVNGYYATREERKEAYENEELDGDLSLGDMRSGISPDWLMDVVTAQGRLARRRNGPHDDALLESAEALEKVMRGRKKTIKMYRAVDADIKENTFRNGDWITPSKKYAQWHTELQSWKKGRIIEQEVSIDDVWWDGNDINEWGYDDGKGYAYKNTENNRKLLEPTYDENGNLIPLSERFNENKEDVRFSLSIKNSDPFYSNAAKATEEIKQNKATGDQWIAMLKKNGGLKAEEDKWMGLTDWLNGKKSVTKEEVEKFIAENAVKVEDVEYAEVNDLDNNPKMQQFQKEYGEALEKYRKEEKAIDEEMEAFDNEMFEKYGEGWANDLKKLSEEDRKRNRELTSRYDMLKDNGIEQLAFGDMIEEYGDDFGQAFEIDYGVNKIVPVMDMYDEISDAAKYFLEFEQQPINSTRLDYTTEGLENKREIALTVPTIEPYNAHDEIHFGDAGGGRAVAWIRFGDSTHTVTEDVPKHVEEFEEPWNNGRGGILYYPKGEKIGWGKEYILNAKDVNGKSVFAVMVNNRDKGHYDTFEEAKDALNRYYEEHPEKKKSTQKVLVIDEIQSKRHQDGREKGYADSKAVKAYNDWMDAKAKEFGVERYQVESKLSDEEYSEMKRLQEAAKKDHGVPDAPFQKNWHELALKRMLRYAAENGYDKIAWTTGEQQADRYNLSGVVDHISYVTLPNGEIDARAYFKNGSYEPLGRTWEEVERNAGKDLARRMQQGEANSTENLEWGIDKDEHYVSYDYNVISGEGLKIGGEGMKGFYDRMLPMFMDKYGKKWGVKTQDVELDLPNEADRVMHSVDVTPEMKESVSQGQPMFSLSDNITKTDETFNSELAKLNEDNADNITLSLGSPSDILKDAGVEDKPMKLYGNKVIKKMKKHGFKLEELKNLPSAVADPIAVFNNYKKEGNRSILTELKTERGNFLVAVTTGKNIDVDFNVISSVFGKGKEKLEDWLRNGKATYINEKKTLDFLYYPAPIAETPKNQESSSGAKIRNFAELNKFLGEKLYIRTNNFKKWFGDWENDPEEASKVVDENGEPLVVYHGTGSYGFNTFKERREWNYDVDREEGVGIFFSSDKENSTGYEDEETAEELGFNTQKGTYSVYLNIKNPLVVDFDGSWWNGRKFTYEVKDAEGKTVNTFLNLQEAKDFAQKQGEGTTIESVQVGSGVKRIGEYVTKARQNGNDGVIIKNVRDSHIDNHEAKPATTYVVFDPNQIKSATENNGNFDRNNADIRFSFLAKEKEREQKREAEESKTMFDAAKKHFGVTNDIREAGYVLPDGSMLDFSGRHEGADERTASGQRHTDHREISKIAYEYDENGEEIETGLKTSMPDFIERGAIHIDGKYGNINLFMKPTDKQKDILRRVIARNDGDVIIDFGNGWDTEHDVEYSGAKPARIFADIDRYFDEGIKPGPNIKFSISPKKNKEGNIEFAYKGDPKSSIRVFHGSAADFDKFDHKFMGTGEGNQSYGWGTYVTEVEDIGKLYAEKLALYKGKAVNNKDPWSDDPAERALYYIEQEGGEYKAIRFLKQLIREEDNANNIRDHEETIEAIKDKSNWKTPERHIYHVDIPADNGNNYLDWEKPLNEEQVRKIVEQAAKEGKDDYSLAYRDDNGNLVPNFSTNSGEWVYDRELARVLGSPKAASEFLLKAGFAGIKIPTNFKAGGNKEGTYNYVIFNENDAQIVDNTKFSFRVPEGKSKAQMQAETDRDIAQRRNVVREGDTYEDVLRKAKAVRDADELVKIEQTISDNQIKPGDSFEEVLRKAEALKTAAEDQQKFSFSREERARQAYERDRKRQQKEINDAQKALRKKIVDEINYLMNDQHLTVFNKSTLSRLLKDVQNADADNIEQTVTSIRTEIDRLTDKSQQRQLEDLMKLKTRDQNGKGMAIAKNVSDSVRRILGMIQGRIVDLKSTGYEEDMTQLRRQNWFLPGENMRLRRTIERLQKEEPTAERTQDMIDAEIAEAEAKIKENEAQVEANKAELADLKVRKQEAESAKALASDADVAEEIAKLMEKMDEHVAGRGTWTPSDSEKLTALQILQLKQQADGKRREIEDMKRKLAELEDSLSRYQAAARHPQRYIPRQRMEQLEQQVQGMKQAINQATDELIGRNGNLIDVVKELIEEGKSSLQNKIEAENNHKYEVLHGVITDIAGDKQIPTDQQKQKDQQEEKKLKKFFSSQLHSFEYLAKRINENSLGEDGFFYNYFIKGKNGVMEAENNHQRGLRDAVDKLDAKAQEIYGCSFLEASEKTAEVDYHSGVFTYRDSDGMEIEEEQPLSKGQAMYIYMVWKMPDGKMKLQNQGFTDESIAQIREFLSPEDMQFADWIQEEFLKDRRAKYNDLYVELYNTSMANIENYVPLKILETEVKRESNLSDDSGRKQTLEEKAGALIERKFNLSPVDITQNAFAVIADHINNMEEWHAFARVRRDLDYVLSNKYIRKQLNANSAGRYNQLYDASAIAAHAYKPNKAEHMDEVVGWLTKGLVGGNIAFRHSTALKQILSVPAFYGYSYDPKFWAALTANIGMQYVRNAPAVLANMATFGISGKAGFKLADKGKMKSLMSENVMWCMKNVPSFRNRVLKGTVGLEYMDQKLNGTVELNIMDHKFKIKVGEMVDKFLDYGMATNQMIDAVTCSIGIKSIFDYRYGKLSEAIEKDTSLTPEQKAEALEEARRKAIMDADIYYNATQQSNHAAFMSSMQMSRSMINRAFSVYQNASIGYARKAVSSSQTVYRIATNFKKLQNEYARRYMAEDPNMDRDEAMFKAREYLLNQAANHALNAFHYGYLMNWLWDLGSKGLLGFWWYSSNKKKDREEELRQATGEDKDFREIAGDYYDKAAELISYPGRGLTGMNVLSSLVNRNLNNPLLLFDELEDMQKDIERCIQNDDYTGISTQVLYRGLKSLTGFDARTHINTLLGVKGLIKDGFTGNQDSDFMINLMLVLNTPDTNRRAVAEELYKDYPLDTYVSNIMKASKYTDNEYLALLPGMKLLTAKNEMQIYKEFAFDNLTDEEKSKLKGVTKMKLDQLRTTAELTDAYNKEADVKIKEAIGRMIIKNMKDELSKNNTPEDLLKKAKENLLGKESAAKNVIYTALCTSNDLIDDEMLKEAIADLKPVMDQLKEIEDEGTIDQEKEYTSLHKAEIDEYERLKDLQKLISEDKRDLKDATPEERIDLMNDIRQLRNEALKRGNAKDGKKEE